MKKKNNNNKRHSKSPHAPFCCVACCEIPDYASLDKALDAYLFEGIHWDEAEGFEFTIGLEKWPFVRVDRYLGGFCVRCNRRLDGTRLSFGLVEFGLKEPTIFWCETCIRSAASRLKN